MDTQKGIKRKAELYNAIEETLESGDLADNGDVLPEPLAKTVARLYRYNPRGTHALDDLALAQLDALAVAVIRSPQCFESREAALIRDIYLDPFKTPQWAQSLIGELWRTHFGQGTTTSSSAPTHSEAPAARGK